MLGSVRIYTNFGYPLPWPWNGSNNITEMVDFSGFTVQTYSAGSFQRVFTKDGAPDPSNCSVTYYVGGGGAVIVHPPTVTTKTSGC
jgi:hypothetical protein